MRNMSFSKTTQEIRTFKKDVTRRLGWANLRPGELFAAIVKGQGLKKGEHVERLAVLRCVSNSAERLDAIQKADCRREGFPHLSPGEFVRMFCRLNKCRPEQIVNRIEFEYVSLNLSVSLNLEPYSFPPFLKEIPHGTATLFAQQTFRS